jgi:hypothetical protein
MGATTFTYGDQETEIAGAGKIKFLDFHVDNIIEQEVSRGG